MSLTTLFTGAHAGGQAAQADLAAIADGVGIAPVQREALSVDLVANALGAQIEPDHGGDRGRDDQQYADGQQRGLGRRVLGDHDIAVMLL